MMNDNVGVKQVVGFMSHNLTILIVDDNAAMRRMIGRIVKDYAGRIYECSDGSQALKAYKENHPDWVLMDIEMKEKDGLTATEEILTNFPKAKILIVTKYDDEGMRNAARCAGACGYVLKENLLDIRGIISSH